VLLILSDIDYVTIDYELCMLNVEINLCYFLFCNYLLRNKTVYQPKYYDDSNVILNDPAVRFLHCCISSMFVSNLQCTCVALHSRVFRYIE